MALHAQDGDYQLRILAHAQFVPKDRHVGVSAWVILPNVMNQESQLRLFLLGGVYKADKRWIEVMAGGLLSRDQSTSFVLDARYSQRTKWMNSFFNVAYNFRTQSLLISPNATLPARIKRVPLRLGAEGDFVFAPSHQSRMVGPRVVVPLPVCRVCKEFSLVSAYRFQSDGRRVVRNYLAVTF